MGLRIATSSSRNKANFRRKSWQRLWAAYSVSSIWIACFCGGFHRRIAVCVFQKKQEKKKMTGFSLGIKTGVLQTSVSRLWLPEKKKSKWQKKSLFPGKSPWQTAQCPRTKRDLILLIMECKSQPWRRRSKSSSDKISFHWCDLSFFCAGAPSPAFRFKFFLVHS